MKPRTKLEVEQRCSSTPPSVPPPLPNMAATMRALACAGLAVLAAAQSAPNYTLG
jgi:hypothetical protein